MENVKKRTRSFDIFFQLSKRHFLVFFKNKMRVFYTLMVPLVILCVYVFFLRDLELTSVESIVKDYGIYLDKNPELFLQIKGLVDSWMLSGIIALSTITVAIQTNNIIVNDKENGVNRDFASSPINKNILICSYFLFNFIVTVLICLIVVLIAFLWLLINQEFTLTFVDFLVIIGVLLFDTIVSTLMTLFICSFIKKEATLASVIAVFSAAAGFLIGAYMPVSMLPKWVSNVVCFIPGTYQCSLFRYAFLNTPIMNLENLLSTMYPGGVIVSPNGTFQLSSLIESIENNFGYYLYFFDVKVGPGFQALVSVIFIGIFIVLDILTGTRLTFVAADGVKKFAKGTAKVFKNNREKAVEKHNIKKDKKDKSSNTKK